MGSVGPFPNASPANSVRPAALIAGSLATVPAKPIGPAPRSDARVPGRPDPAPDRRGTRVRPSAVSSRVRYSSRYPRSLHFGTTAATGLPPILRRCQDGRRGRRSYVGGRSLGSGALVQRWGRSLVGAVDAHGVAESPTPRQRAGFRVRRCRAQVRVPGPARAHSTVGATATGQDCGSGAGDQLWRRCRRGGRWRDRWDRILQNLIGTVHDGHDQQGIKAGAAMINDQVVQPIGWKIA